MARLVIFLLLYFATGCQLRTREVPVDNQLYNFDTLVIEKLPLYDSLVAAILEKSLYFQQHMDKNDSYRAYKYMPLSNEKEVFNKLPQEVAAKIDPCFTKLGKYFIYGFDVFKDSTIKIYIRKMPSEELQLDIEENLSYYPEGTHIRRRTSPVKDTLLNKHWLYWTRFNKRGLF